jgi:hypothetical protein
MSVSPLRNILSKSQINRLQTSQAYLHVRALKPITKISDQHHPYTEISYQHHPYTEISDQHHPYTEISDEHFSAFHMLWSVIFMKTQLYFLIQTFKPCFNVDVDNLIYCNVYFNANEIYTMRDNFTYRKKEAFASFDVFSRWSHFG